LKGGENKVNSQIMNSMGAQIPFFNLNVNQGTNNQQTVDFNQLLLDFTNVLNGLIDNSSLQAEGKQQDSAVQPIPTLRGEKLQKSTNKGNIPDNLVNPMIITLFQQPMDFKSVTITQPISDIPKISNDLVKQLKQLFNQLEAMNNSIPLESSITDVNPSQTSLKPTNTDMDLSQLLSILLHLKTESTEQNTGVNLQNKCQTIDSPEIPRKVETLEKGILVESSMGHEIFGQAEVYKQIKRLLTEFGVLVKEELQNQVEPLLDQSVKFTINQKTNDMGLLQNSPSKPKDFQKSQLNIQSNEELSSLANVKLSPREEQRNIIVKVKQLNAPVNTSMVMESNVLDAKIESATKIGKPTKTSEDSTEVIPDQKLEPTNQINTSFVPKEVKLTTVLQNKPTETIPVNQNFTNELGKVIVKHVQLPNGISETKIQLHPQELGQIDVKITSHQGQISAQLVADTVVAKEMIEGQIQQLKQSLIQLGFVVDRIEVQHVPSSPSSHTFQDMRGGFQFSQQQQTARQFSRPKQNLDFYYSDKEEGFHGMDYQVTGIDYTA